MKNHLTEAIEKERLHRVEVLSKKKLSSMKDIKERLELRSRGIRPINKLSFEELYLANKSQLDAQYPKPLHHREYRDPDGFEYPYDLTVLNKLFTN